MTDADSLRMLREISPSSRPVPRVRTFEICWDDAREPCALGGEHHWHFRGEVLDGQDGVRSTDWLRWCCSCGTTQTADHLAEDEEPACGPFVLPPRA